MSPSFVRHLQRIALQTDLKSLRLSWLQQGHKHSTTAFSFCISFRLHPLETIKGRITKYSVKSHTRLGKDIWKSLTIWHRLWLWALQTQGRSKACPVVEAPALLHFCGAPLGRNICTWWSSVTNGRLSVLDTLPSWTSHPYPFLKA